MTPGLAIHFWVGPARLLKSICSSGIEIAARDKLAIAACLLILAVVIGVGGLAATMVVCLLCI